MGPDRSNMDTILIDTVMDNPICVDTREPLSIYQALVKIGCLTKREQLAIGDYTFNDAKQQVVVVTRKSGDLFDSFFDGHFADEIQRCMNYITSNGGGTLWWLQEGPWRAQSDGNHEVIEHQRLIVPPPNRVHEAGYNLIPSLQIASQCAGLYYLTTSSHWETARAIEVLYIRAQLGWPISLITRLHRAPLKVGRDDEMQRTRRLMTLWPRLSERQAKALLLKYGSIYQIVEEMHTNTLTLPGIGAKMKEAFRRVIQ